MVKLAYINGKGGCGKTTGIFHTAGILASENEKVLVIDMDKQRNASDTFLTETKKMNKTLFDLMLGEATAEEVTMRTLFQSRSNGKPQYQNVDCITSDVRLQDEKLLSNVNAEDFGNKINAFIEKQGYTWVIVDMPPSNKVLNEICFRHIVEYVISPFTSDTYSVSGFGDLMDIVNDARKINPSLNILGIYLSRYMKNCAVDKYIKSQLENFGDIFIDVQIPHAVDIREGTMMHRPLSYYKSSSDSLKAYKKLLEEIKKRVGGL